MKQHYFFLFMLLFIFTVGCSSDPDYMEEMAIETKGPAGPESAFDGYKEGPVVLGKDLSAIYSVEMMRSAYGQKYPNGDGQYGPSGIRTTHYYVRFLPKNEDEYDEIVHYGLSEIPLYSEIVQGGSTYHDPSIPADQYTWQYALIPVDEFELTRVRWEKLQDMFIINKGQPGVAGPGGSPSYSFWEALEIINHKHETGEDIGPGISWTPSGKIEVYDDLLLKYIPLVGLKIVISRGGGEQETVTTDVTGSFKSTKKYSTSVCYTIKWASNPEFEIKDGDISQAYLVSKRSFLPFNVKLNNDDKKQKNFATIFRAGQRVYYKDYLNMDRPIVKPWGLPQRPMKIAYHIQQDCPFGGIYQLNAVYMENLKPNIVVCNVGSCSNDVFGTTIHEFAHAGHHIKFSKYSWTIPKQIVHESWASAVEYYITKLEYADYGKDIDDYVKIMPPGPTTYGSGGVVNPGVSYILPNGVNKQWWPHAGNQLGLLDKLEYSSLVIDLVDNNNQALYYKLKPVPNVSHKTYPNDDVSGFELSKIQTTLDVTGLADFKNKIKQLNSRYYSNKNTSIQIDTLFNRYEHYWNK